MNPEILVIGIGNPERGDDGAGRAVAGLLKGRLPQNTGLMEHSGEGISLMESWEGVKKIILVDAVFSGAEPGTIHRFDAAEGPFPAFLRKYSTHAFGVGEAVEMARALKRMPERLVFFGVEGASFEAGAEIGPRVAESLDKVSSMVLAEAEGR